MVSGAEGDNLMRREALSTVIYYLFHSDADGVEEKWRHCTHEGNKPER